MSGAFGIKEPEDYDDNIYCCLAFVYIASCWKLCSLVIIY
jgi:hypothetical protein